LWAQDNTQTIQPYLLWLLPQMCHSVDLGVLSIFTNAVIATSHRNNGHKNETVIHRKGKKL